MTFAVTFSIKNNRSWGSVGKVVSFMSLKVRDLVTSKALGPNQVGEIVLKSPQALKGYYRNEKVTKEAFTEDGWFKTGDLGYYNEEEYVFLVDRLKEIMKYKGFQVKSIMNIYF